MPGAWEGVHDTVLCGILHVDTVTVAWSLGLKNLIVPGPVIGVAGMPFDHARNAINQKALEIGADYVFHYDSDIIAPHDTILRLLRHRLPIVSGMYCRRSPPHGVPVMIKDGQWLSNFVPGSLVEVDYCGAGCLLLDCDFLRKVPPLHHGKPWFHWRVDLRGTGVFPDNECMSEDFSFMIHVKKTMGVKTFVDTSIQCRHLGFFECGLGTAKPLETVG